MQSDEEIVLKCNLIKNNNNYVHERFFSDYKSNI